jgi:hypothetical protein
MILENRGQCDVTLWRLINDKNNNVSIEDLNIHYHNSSYAQWDQTLILTISHSEIKGKNTDNITQWDQRKTYWQYHTVRSKEKILTISHWVRSKEIILTISHWDQRKLYWQYHTVRSKEKIYFLWSQCDIVSIISFDLTVWYCQYYILWSHCVILSVLFPLISQCDIVSIFSFDLSVILSVFFPLISYHTGRSKEKILTISHCEIKGNNTDNITLWDQRK